MLNIYQLQIHKVASMNWPEETSSQYSESHGKENQLFPQ